MKGFLKIPKQKLITGEVERPWTKLRVLEIRIWVQHFGNSEHAANQGFEVFDKVKWGSGYSESDQAFKGDTPDHL